jgi:hypothetical protein
MEKGKLVCMFDVKSQTTNVRLPKSDCFSFRCFSNLPLERLMMIDLTKSNKNVKFQIKIKNLFNLKTFQIVLYFLLKTE